MTRGRRFGTVRLRSGQALEWSVPKAHERERSRLHRQRCTSEDARAYIDGIFAGEGARATRPASTSVTCGARRKRPTSLSLNGDSLSGARIERASVVRSPHIGEKRMKSKILVLGFACLSLVAMAQDDWHQQRVAVGDVNGDGKADVTASSSAQGSGQNAAVNTSHSNIKNQRDMATGQASGKRQHQPMTVSKEVDKASPKN